MKWALISVFVAALPTGFVAMSAHAVGQDVPANKSAKQREDERKAMAALAASDYQNALPLLLQLYTNYHDVEHLRDIARCYLHAKKTESAIATLTEYLAQAKQLSPREKAGIEAEMKELRALQIQPGGGTATLLPSSQGTTAVSSATSTAPSSTGETASSAWARLAAGAPANAAASASAPPASHEENGKRLLEGGQFAEALAEFAQAYRSTKNPTLLHDMALCHLCMGNTEQALELYEDYVVRVPDSPRRSAIMARIRELRQGVAANKPVAEASSLDPPTSSALSPPSPATAHDQSGKRLFQSGQYAEAAAELDKAYRISHDPAFLYDLALCRDRLHSTKQALELYEDYLMGTPNSPQRAQIEARIQELRQDLAGTRAPPSAPPPAVMVGPSLPVGPLGCVRGPDCAQPIVVPPVPPPAQTGMPVDATPPGVVPASTEFETRLGPSPVVPEQPSTQPAPEAASAAVQQATSASAPPPPTVPQETPAPATRPAPVPSRVSVAAASLQSPQAAGELPRSRETGILVSAQFLLSPGGRWVSSFCQSGLCGHYEGNMAGTIGAAVAAEHRVLRFLAYGLDLSYLREKPKAAQSYADDLQVGPSVRFLTALASIEVYARFAMGLRLSFLPGDLTQLDNTGAHLASTGTGWFLHASGGLIVHTGHAGIFLEPGYFYGTATTSSSGNNLDISAQYFLLTTGVILFL